MITLNQFVPSGKKPDPSVFCTKVELFLKVYKIPYVGKSGNPMKAPKGKLPTIQDDGNLISDSEVIIKYLSEKHNIDIERTLSNEQKALSLMIRKTLEEYFYFIILHTRWIDDAGFKEIPKVIFGNLPALPRMIVPKIVRPQVRKQLFQQGIGRHDTKEVGRRGSEVLKSLAFFMGQSDFLFGNEPSHVDFVVFPVLWGALHYPSDSEIRKVAESYPVFKKYVNNILTKYYQ